MGSTKKSLGQCFTPAEVAEFMVSLIAKQKDATVLEPCAGTGVFLTSLEKAGFKNIIAYEIDSSLPNY
ncbi:MAG: N-6 DNA methylase [Sulfolobales archaeon]